VSGRAERAVSVPEPVPGRLDAQQFAASLALAPNQRMMLLLAFREAGESGLIDEEAAERVGLLGTRSRWVSRCSDLRRDGLIEETADAAERQAETGMWCKIHICTPSGAAMLSAHDM